MESGGTLLYICIFQLSIPSLLLWAAESSLDKPFTSSRPPVPLDKQPQCEKKADWNDMGKSWVQLLWRWIPPELSQLASFSPSLAPVLIHFSHILWRSKGMWSYSSYREYPQTEIIRCTYDLTDSHLTLWIQPCLHYRLLGRTAEFLLLFLSRLFFSIMYRI